MAAKGMKGLLAWCKKNTEGYRDVNVTNMSSSWKDGLAFCALLHKFHPELIDFDSLSKENVLYNNQLAFEIAEDLGIAAFLDAEDMVNMKTPDKLSVMTYLSQYYNCFKDSKPGEHDAKHTVVNPVNNPKTLDSPKKANDVSLCTICGKKVHLVQRYFEDGMLYHRTCHRTSSLDNIRGKNYFIKQTKDRTNDSQSVTLPKVKGGSEATPTSTPSDQNEILSITSKSGDTGNIAVDTMQEDSDKDSQASSHGTKDDISKPLPKPRVRTLPANANAAANTVTQSSSNGASKPVSDDDYDDELNPFGSDSDSQETLSSTSSEDDTNPFASTAESKSESKITGQQQSESENEGNPFGDDDIDEVADEGSGNPFGDCDKEEIETSQLKPKQPERFNPFAKDSGEEPVVESKTVPKKAPPRPVNSPAVKAPPKSRKKAPAPPPPTWKIDSTQKMVEMNRANERNARFPQKKTVEQKPISPCTPSTKMDRFKLRRLSTPKSRAAPGYGHPLVKRKVHIAMTEDEITTELKLIDIKLTDYETKGVKLEEMLRFAMNKDVEWTNEEDELLNEWFDLVNKKNILLRDESDLVFQLQQQRLEQEHADIEFELRKLLNKPDSAKTEDDKKQEEELLQKLVEVVERRNVIINSIEEERLKEAEEDSMYEQMKWMKENPGKKKKKNKVKKMFSKKEKKKEKKAKDNQ